VGSTGTNQPGTGEMEKMVNVGLTISTNQGPREARLAEAVPTTDNGLWKVLPDGRMQMTWKLRQNARWHDGAPFTSEDLLFTAAVAQDRELAMARNQIHDFVERVEAPDPSTVVVWWREPYIDADGMFAGGGSMPLPRHLLAQAHAENKPGFAQLPYWSEQYVGTGPFKLKDWVSGSHVVVTAFESYFLGRPRLDEIEVKFIPSPNTIVANVLAGAVELTMGRGISFDQAVQVRNQWREGKAEFSFNNPVVIGPQFLNPNPPIITDVRFRRALYHALNRQEMADALQLGLVGVAHSGLPLNDPLYRDVERQVIQYEYDPRKATQMVEGLGYARGPDGFFADSAGQRLSVNIISTSTDLYAKTALVAADYWQRVGVGAEAGVVPDGRERDLEFRATFPGFEVVSSGSGIDSLRNFKKSEIRLPENRFQGRNRVRYGNDQLESLIGRYYVTIPLPERMQILGDIVHHLTDQVVFLYVFYSGEPTLIGNRLVNVFPPQEASITWNVHEWDVRS
jgi:peptide/nickel transport system substrate-binding protein